MHVASFPASLLFHAVISLLPDTFEGLILLRQGKCRHCGESLAGTFYLISLWSCGIDLQSCLGPAVRVRSAQAGNHNCCSINQHDNNLRSCTKAALRFNTLVLLRDDLHSFEQMVFTIFHHSLLESMKTIIIVFMVCWLARSHADVSNVDRRLYKSRTDKISFTAQ